MSGLTKQHWQERRAAWALALYRAAESCGKGSKLYKILGTVVWGRYDGEPQPQETKDNIVFGAGFLEGVRYAALRAGDEFRLPGTEHLREIHNDLRQDRRPSGWSVREGAGG